MDTTPSPKFPRALVILAALTVLIAFAFALDASEWLRGGFGWRWPYALQTYALPLLLIMVVGYGVGAFWLMRRTARAAPILAWAMLGAVLFALAATYARDPDPLRLLYARTVSLVAAGEYLPAAQFNPEANVWQNWPLMMARYGGNVATSPPGMFMLYTASSDFFEAVPSLADPLYRVLMPYQCFNYNLLDLSAARWASAWFGILTPLWAALSVFPLYSIARRAGGTSAARYAVLLWALVPGMAIFATSSSTFFPLVALLVQDSLERGLTHGLGVRRGRAWVVFAGVLYGVGMFLNFVFLPLAALYGFTTLIHYARIDRHNGRKWTYPIQVGAWFGLGALMIWGIYTAATGETFFDLLAQSLRYHLQLERPYTFWVWFHVWDWAVFSGIIGVGLAVMLALRRAPPPQSAGAQRLAWAALLTVLALTLSGTTRGESGRIWLFISPFVIAAGAALIPHGRAWLMLAFAQGALFVALAVGLDAYQAPDLTPPSVTQIALSNPIDAVFSDPTDGGAFRLTAWEATTNGGDIDLKLNWQGVERAWQHYWFGVTLVAPDGQTFGSQAWQPYTQEGQRLPTTCWANGVTLTDTTAIALPADAPRGEYWISLAAFGDTSNPEGRLTVTQGGTVDTQVGFGPIEIR